MKELKCELFNDNFQNYKWTPSEKRRVMYMWRAGIGYAAIGKKLGRNPRSVADLVQREIKDNV